ncbi:MAG TPA: hypothetical protein VD836_03100 [Solirubrobacteraceae bacterium]|nr:hypothetical protein [Solirubrobacteraceae bacterium]
MTADHGDPGGDSEHGGDGDGEFDGDRDGEFDVVRDYRGQRRTRAGDRVEFDAGRRPGGGTPADAVAG